MIHPTAVIHDGAKVGVDCNIGPFCIVGPNVTLGDRVNLVSHVVIENNTIIGDDTIVYPFAALGGLSQDLKWQDPESMTGLRIGKRCRIREYVTIHSGTPASNGTEIGDDCQIMVNAHVGHDCKVGNSVVMSNLAQLAGHVEVEDFAIISAGCMVLQFVHIGRNAFIGGMGGVGNDVVPYAIYEGARARYRTVNRLGLMRHGFTNEDIHAIHTVYNAVFKETDGVMAERLRRVRKEVKNNKYALDAIDFIENRVSKYGIGHSNNAE